MCENFSMAWPLGHMVKIKCAITYYTKKSHVKISQSTVLPLSWLCILLLLIHAWFWQVVTLYVHLWITNWKSFPFQWTLEDQKMFSEHYYLIVYAQSLFIETHARNRSCVLSKWAPKPASTLAFTVWKICTHGPFHQQKRKDHTIVSYVSGAGFSLPLFMIYSCKRITEILKEGAYPGTYKFQLQWQWMDNGEALYWLVWFLSEDHSSNSTSTLIEDVIRAMFQ